MNYEGPRQSDAITLVGAARSTQPSSTTASAAKHTYGDEQADLLIGDSENFIADAALDHAECVCGNKHLELTVGVLGARCVDCGLVGVYGDWKNGYNGYQELLNRV